MVWVSWVCFRELLAVLQEIISTPFILGLHPHLQPSQQLLRARRNVPMCACNAGMLYKYLDLSSTSSRWHWWTLRLPFLTSSAPDFYLFIFSLILRNRRLSKRQNCWYLVMVFYKYCLQILFANTIYIHLKFASLANSKHILTGQKNSALTSLQCSRLATEITTQNSCTVLTKNNQNRGCKKISN